MGAASHQRLPTAQRSTGLRLAPVASPTWNVLINVVIVVGRRTGAGRSRCRPCPYHGHYRRHRPRYGLKCDAVLDAESELELNLDLVVVVARLTVRPGLGVEVVDEGVVFSPVDPGLVLQSSPMRVMSTGSRLGLVGQVSWPRWGTRGTWWLGTQTSGLSTDSAKRPETSRLGTSSIALCRRASAKN